jgi:hypothetical protein
VRLKRLGVAAALAAVAIAAAIGLVVVMGVFHEKTVAADVADVDEPDPDHAPGYLDVRVKLVALDLNQETVGLQLECVPKGRYLVDAAGQLKRRLVLTAGVSASGMEKTMTLLPGAKGGVTTIGLDLDGNVEDYPWDRHTTSLWLSAAAYRKGRLTDAEITPIRMQA